MIKAKKSVYVGVQVSKGSGAVEGGFAYFTERAEAEAWRREAPITSKRAISANKQEVEVFVGQDGDPELVAVKARGAKPVCAKCGGWAAVQNGLCGGCYKGGL